jgi:hypothetical protein
LQIAKLNIQGLGVKKGTSPFLTANEYRWDWPCRNES